MRLAVEPKRISVDVRSRWLETHAQPVQALLHLQPSAAVIHVEQTWRQWWARRPAAAPEPAAVAAEGAVVLHTNDAFSPLGAALGKADAQQSADMSDANQALEPVVISSKGDSAAFGRAELHIVADVTTAAVMGLVPGLEPHAGNIVVPLTGAEHVDTDDRVDIPASISPEAVQLPGEVLSELELESALQALQKERHDRARDQRHAAAQLEALAANIEAFQRRFVAEQLRALVEGARFLVHTAAGADELMLLWFRCQNVFSQPCQTMRLTI